jgi:protoporphyrinogen oxidase
MIDTSRVTQNTWLYIPERKYTFFRIQEFPNWHPNTAPRGKTSLTLEIACEKGGRLWKMNDADFLEVCLADLKKMGIQLEGKIMDYFCTFAEHAYPVYSLRYKEHLQKIYDFVKSLKNLVICGRQGLFRYLNMDRAIENGFEAIESLFDENKKIDFLSGKESKEYLETNLCLKKNV